jgi:tetratricopeptide (TPR) repeat protein
MSRIIACWLISLTVTGCAHNAKITVWQPAAADARQLGRVVVMPFTGENGNAVAAGLTSRLDRGRVYDVIDRTELPMIAQVSLDDRDPADYQQAAAVAARKAGADGVVFGHIFAYECETRVAPNSDYMGPRRFGPERFAGTSPYQERVSEWMVARVGLEYRLVDSESGEERASGKVIREYNEPKKFAADVSREEVLSELVEECLDEVEQHLTPHKQTTSVKLAGNDWSVRGRPEVRQGCVAAERGRWREAETKWQEALALDEDNHAALYNLGIAAANRLDYEESEDLIMRAIRIKHCDCYEQGLSQIRRHREDYERAESQQAKSDHHDASRSVTQVH